MKAVIKAISSVNKGKELFTGSSAPLIGIEILNSSSGAPVVILHQHIREGFRGKYEWMLTCIEISILKLWQAWCKCVHFLHVRKAMELYTSY